jgi:hypothetical protein
LLIGDEPGLAWFREFGLPVPFFYAIGETGVVYESLINFESIF